MGNKSLSLRKEGQAELEIHSFVEKEVTRMTVAMMEAVDGSGKIADLKVSRGELSEAIRPLVVEGLLKAFADRYDRGVGEVYENFILDSLVAEEMLELLPDYE